SVRKLKMAKAKRNIGEEILDGLRELKRGKHARVVNVPDVGEIREKTGLSQARFAELLGVSVRTLQDWEQGRRAPSGAARTLLLIADRDPTVLLKVAYPATSIHDGLMQMPARRSRCVYFLGRPAGGCTGGTCTRIPRREPGGRPNPSAGGWWGWPSHRRSV